jgi:2'-5' RNA ligase
LVPVRNADSSVLGQGRAGHGLPAHITLIYPFLPPDLLQPAMIQTLARFFAGTPPFAFDLPSVAGFPNVVYMVPVPGEPFIELIAALTRLFPETPPYGGAFPITVPHVTVAESADPLVLDRAVLHASKALPIHALATEAWLMTGNNGSWHRVADFPLGRLSNSFSAGAIDEARST